KESKMGTVLDRHRRPHLRVLRKLETRWHHADNRLAITLDADRAADDGGVATEAIAPEIVGDDHDGTPARLFIAGAERAAELWSHAERVEERHRHVRGLETQRLTGAE